VCRKLNAIAEAELFSHIIIDVGLKGADTTAAQLQALSCGRMSHYAETLKIRTLWPISEDDQSFISRIVHGSYQKKRKVVAAMVRVRKYLQSAIISLTNVTTVLLVMPSVLLACITYGLIAG
jgi:hypothetical protein